MARRASSKSQEVKTNGRRISGAKTDETLGSPRAGQGKVSSVGLTKGSAEAHTEGRDHLHQLIAERAYLLYERSGFQDGNDLEHWLEAERQVKGVCGQAA